MPIPQIRISEATKHYALGAIGGMVALAMVAYSYKIMLTPAEAERLGKARSDVAVAQALAPFCAERFRAQRGAPAQLVQLKGMDHYQQASFLEKGGWATLPGSDLPRSGVAEACSALLTKAG